MGQYGIKETKEAIVGGIKLAAVISKQAKDGVQLSDFAAVIAEYQANPEFKNAMDAAYENIGQVPMEIQELDFKECLELAGAIVKELPSALA